MGWLVIWVIFLLVVGLPGGCLFQQILEQDCAAYGVTVSQPGS